MKKEIIQNPVAQQSTPTPTKRRKNEKDIYLFIYLKKRQTKLGIQLSKFMPIVLKSLLGIKG